MGTYITIGDGKGNVDEIATAHARIQQETCEHDFRDMHPVKCCCKCLLCLPMDEENECANCG